MSAPTTLAAALREAQAQGLPRLEAQMLVLLAVTRAPHDRAWLMAHDTDVLTAPQQAHLAGLVARRLAGEPMAYLTGRHEFYGLDLAVDARVLDPRDDTETLVDWGLEVITPLPHPRVADLGTGSGAIALAVASQRRDAEVSAVDASAEALAVAQGNAHRLGLTVRFLQGDWCAPLGEAPFALLLSNPPYIADHDPHLPALRHEPLQALVSGPDGLDDLRRIIAQAPAHLLTGGWLLLEHGWDQAAPVRELLQARGFEQVQSRKDLAGIERCSGGLWPGLR
ncbi:peptide chain release factor N(5)-glutamine methyltransferase [Curvibacter gracilis]|uniref:peptide chain release factor N(5)-glutamine methyltransferase n=1 Tax=Curvibacter gracilis TaxID=230310 RepID=UPI000489C46C|nr:peptide chain release factor N(5)-glutamine methyltransferase [Curvibacter gracilis]